MAYKHITVINVDYYYYYKDYLYGFFKMLLQFQF